MADLVRSQKSRAIDRLRSDDGGVSEYLAFRVGPVDYAVPVSIVREIVRHAHITPVPRAPHAVLGITSFRGRIVTVLDVGARLRAIASPSNDPERRGPLAPGGAGRSRIVMVELTAEIVGLRVDEVDIVYRLTSHEIERAHVSVGSDVGDHVVGLARPGGGELIVQLIDARALMP